MDEDRRPGWYPDPRVGGRFRFWGSGRWHAVTSSDPVWGSVDATGGRVEAVRLDRRLAVVAAVAVVALLVIVGIGWLVASRGTSGSDDPGADRSGVDRSEESAEPPSERSDGNGPDGAAGGASDDEASGWSDAAANGDRSGEAATPDGGSPDGGSPNGGTGPSDEGGREPDTPPAPATSVPLVSVPPTPSCSITEAEFTAALDSPEIRRVIGDERFGDVRCAPSWATARTVNGMIAVVQQSEAGWSLAALGNDSPCLELGLPAELSAALAC